MQNKMVKQLVLKITISDKQLKLEWARKIQQKDNGMKVMDKLLG